NISPNHLDVHRDMDEYVSAKKNIFLHQHKGDRLILNLDNELTRSFEKETRGSVCWFSYNSPDAFEDKDGAFLSSDGYLCLKNQKGVQKIMHKSSIQLPGEHNVENYLTAIAAVGDVVSAEHMRSVAESFGGVEHRIELVRTLDGVRYYNDSIASSPTRTIAGLRAFPQKVILIAGGYDKNLSFDPLAPLIKEKVSLLITLGATAEKIEKAVLRDPSPLSPPEIIRVADMAEAVITAHKRAHDGDIVLMSPASASFDMYRNFELRGRHFKELVNAL
ncbi:MAG: UDP-N-acetylmuramoyl-L-alanine--D-glutamate ligase, partial [Oscillospiraceae bacterium]|nr:UDP-N-acetylmuramoyl-L-alanine--D-glutamate ligase [Oscillospiraceae bacterium]